MGFGKGYGFLREGMGVGRGKMALPTDDSIVLARVIVCVPTSFGTILWCESGPSGTLTNLNKGRKMGGGGVWGENTKIKWFYNLAMEPFIV